MNKKVLFVGDNHIDDRQPIERIDNYFQSGLLELSECLRIGRDNECDAVVFLGDIFHRMEPSGACRNEVLKILLNDENEEPWPFEKYVTIGNHDVRHNPSNLASSALGTLIEVGALKCVEVANDLGIGFVHFAPHVCQEMADGLLKKIQKRYEEPIIIWSIHASVTLSKYYGDHIIVDDVPVNPECRMLVAGHIHMPMRKVRGDNVVFINPGSIGRTALNQENINRIPEVLFVEYDTETGDMRRYVQPLEFSKPPDEIFHIRAAENRKRQKEDTKKYITQLASISAWSSVANKYPDVIELAVAVLQEAHEKQIKTTE